MTKEQAETIASLLNHKAESIIGMWQKVFDEIGKIELPLNEMYNYSESILTMGIAHSDLDCDISLHDFSTIGINQILLSVRADKSNSCIKVRSSATGLHYDFVYGVFDFLKNKYVESSCKIYTDLLAYILIGRILGTSYNYDLVEMVFEHPKTIAEINRLLDVYINSFSEIGRAYINKYLESVEELKARIAFCEKESNELLRLFGIANTDTKCKKYSYKLNVIKKEVKE